MRHSTRRWMIGLTAAVLAVAALVSYVWPRPDVVVQACATAGLPSSAADDTAALLARYYPRSATFKVAPQLTNESPLRFVPNPDGPGFVPDQRALADIERDARERLSKPGWHPIRPEMYVRPVLPQTFAESFAVRSQSQEVRARPVGAASASAETAADGMLIYKDAFPGCDVAYRASALKTEEFIVIRSGDREIGPSSELSTQNSALRTFSWDLDVPPALKPRLSPAHTIEFVDSQGVPRLRINAPEGKDADGKVLRAGSALSADSGTRLKLTLDGARLTLAADVSGLQLPVVIDPSWSSTGSMAVGRYVHKAAMLGSGRVLVVGGSDGAPLDSCETYDPSSGAWTTTGVLGTPRRQHTITVLGDGTVLAAGGYNGSIALTTCELYSVASGTWSPAAGMTLEHVQHTATLLGDGTVLVAGGWGSGNAKSCEVYNPGSGSWALTGSFATGRYDHTATLLGNGTVIAAGGIDSSSTISTCEVYDPAAGTWVATGAMARHRSEHTATRLGDGSVLVVAGDGGGMALTACELYNPTTATWTATGDLTTPQNVHTATLLSCGKVLVIGQSYSGEVYDPASGSWSSTPGGYLFSHTATRLGNGRVLVAGGSDGYTLLASCELYDPAPAAVAQTITVHMGTAAAITLTAETLNQPLTFTVVNGPATGTLTGTVPDVTYTPNAAFVGADSFTFKANDGYFDGTVATVTIDVTNTAPVADDQNVTLQWGTAKGITLTGNDADSDALTFAVVAQPQHGTLSGTAPNLTYTPTGAYVGSDSFTFKVNDGAADSNVATVTIAVTNTAPIVTVSAAPASIVPSGDVVFTANGSDPDGDAVTYSWTFGDGGTSTEQNPTHAYTTVGVYTATVIVTDPLGATGSASVTVQVSKAPIVRLTTSDVVAFASNAFQFDASYSTDPENAIASYTWDFGDNTPPGSGQLISKVYDTPGEYTVTLTVTDAAGVSSTLTRVIQVLPADEMGLFNGFVNYQVKWDRTKENKDSLSLTASVNVGDTVVGPGLPVAVEIAGVRFAGTLDTKLRDYSNKDVKWQVKAGLRHQPFGAVLVSVKIKKATLGAGFNQAGAVVGADPTDTVSKDIPAKIEIGDRSFDVAVPSDFDFNKDGTKARGTGEF